MAAGIVPIAHATNAAGSIRIPAAACGVFGLKPTRGRVSNGPLLDEAIHGLAAQLGVNRTVRDSAALLDAVSGADDGAPFPIAGPHGRYLSQVGADPGRGIDLSTLEPQILAVYRSGRAIGGIDIVRALDLRNAVTLSVAAFFAHYDLLLTPTLPDLAPLIGSYAAGAETMDGHQWTAHVTGGSPFTPVFNAAGVPAMSMPLFQDAASALPVGMPFVAPARARGQAVPAGRPVGAQPAPGGPQAGHPGWRRRRLAANPTR